jgi:squalene-hopene/tetraprenyl-beta-curcumene cyclase
MYRLTCTALVALLMVPAVPVGEVAGTDFATPAPNRKDEPAAKKFSAARAAEFLDAVAVHWTRQRQCGSCHTSFPYLMARPALSPKGQTAAAYQEVRSFFEDRVDGWDSGRDGSRPRTRAEVMAVGVVLAFSDAQTTGKLHPRTRAALDRAWTLQRPDGAWDWDKCDWPPLEHDDYYGATFVALGVGIAPESYAQTDRARLGLARLREYFRKTPAPDLHHRAMLLWASRKVDGLMTRQEQAAAVQQLRDRQRADGGWSLPSLGHWKRRDGSDNDSNAPSDGYATGLVVYVLRQAGVARDDPAVQRGVAWLKGNQRASGRWFTFSLNTDRAHYISNAGTALAVLALQACEALGE